MVELIEFKNSKGDVMLQKKVRNDLAKLPPLINITNCNFLQYQDNARKLLGLKQKAVFCGRYFYQSKEPGDIIYYFDENLHEIGHQSILGVEAFNPERIWSTLLFQDNAFVIQTVIREAN